MPAGQDDRDRHEQGWLDGLRAGNRAVFETIFLSLGPDLWEFAARYVSPDAADDVVQDVLFALWERRATIQIATTLRAYLFGAVRRRAFEHLRHDRVVDATAATTEAENAAWMGEEPAAPDAAASLAELEAAIDAVLATLPERQRILLTLRWRHGMTYDQIAEAMGISVAAAKMQVSRTQRVVRPLLERLTRG